MELDHTNSYQRKIWPHIIVHHTSKADVFLSIDINVAVFRLQLRRGADVTKVCALHNETKPTVGDKRAATISAVVCKVAREAVSQHKQDAVTTRTLALRQLLLGGQDGLRPRAICRAHGHGLLGLCIISAS